MNKKNKLILVGLFFFFIILRLPGITLPYHQDEWKVVRGVEMGASGASGLFHPPLTQLLFRADGALFGSDYMRVLPLVFSLFSAFLLFVVVRRRSGEGVALLSLFLYAICFYSIWASLMVDTDGAILPTFFLLAVYAYDRRRWWLLGAALLLGLMVKLSFVLAIGALLFDFLWENRQNINRKQLVSLVTIFLGFSGLALATTFVVSIVYPAFSVSGMVAHARSFVHISDRNYLQVIIQAVKSLYYLSPLLLLPLVLVSRGSLKKMRIFAIYLILGAVFYFILFDFSRGALDKYLMFLIVPLCALVAEVITPIMRSVRPRIGGRALLFGLVLSVLLFALNFVPHINAPLYPKTEWFGRVSTGEWNVLTPLNGGSGPVGFYVSFLFISLAFISSLVLILLSRYSIKFRSVALSVILVVGVGYNLVFASELFFGKINGNTSVLLNSAIGFIQQSKEVKQVITYNDIGAYELMRIDKYAGRFYASPQFEANHKDRFAEFSGHYLVIDIPPLYQGFYTDFFAKCANIFTDHSGVITAKVYSCPERP